MGGLLELRAMVNLDLSMHLPFCVVGNLPTYTIGISDGRRRFCKCGFIRGISYQNLMRTVRDIPQRLSSCERRGDVRGMVRQLLEGLTPESPSQDGQDDCQCHQ